MSLHISQKDQSILEASKKALQDMEYKLNDYYLNSNYQEKMNATKITSFPYKTKTNTHSQLNQSVSQYSANSDIKNFSQFNYKPQPRIEPLKTSILNLYDHNIERERLSHQAAQNPLTYSSKGCSVIPEADLEDPLSVLAKESQTVSKNEVLLMEKLITTQKEIILKLNETLHVKDSLQKKKNHVLANPKYMLYSEVPKFVRSSYKTPRELSQLNQGNSRSQVEHLGDIKAKVNEKNIQPNLFDSIVKNTNGRSFPTFCDPNEVQLDEVNEMYRQSEDQERQVGSGNQNYGNFETRRSSLKSGISTSFKTGPQRMNTSPNVKQSKKSMSVRRSVLGSIKSAQKSRKSIATSKNASRSPTLKSKHVSRSQAKSKYETSSMSRSQSKTPEKVPTSKGKSKMSKKSKKSKSKVVRVSPSNYRTSHKQSTATKKKDVYESNFTSRRSSIQLQHPKLSKANHSTSPTPMDQKFKKTKKQIENLPEKKSLILTKSNLKKISELTSLVKGITTLVDSQIVMGQTKASEHVQSSKKRNRAINTIVKCLDQVPSQDKRRQELMKNISTARFGKKTSKSLRESSQNLEQAMDTPTKKEAARRFIKMLK